MTFSQYVAMAGSHVDQRGAKVLNYDQEGWAAIIEFCRTRKWRWRRGSGNIMTVAGTSTYDMTSSASGMLDAPDIEEIDNVYMVDGDGEIHKLDEITNENDIALALETTEQDDPQKYFRTPGIDTSLTVSPVPDAADKLRVMYWRVPLFETAVPDPDAIPLVPGYLHPTLVKYLEVRLLHYSLGEEDESYNTAKAELEEMMQVAVANETGG